MSETGDGSEPRADTTLASADHGNRGVRGRTRRGRGRGAALGLELTRHATPAEATAAGQRLQASLWERLTAGQIFPRIVGYTTAAGQNTTAVLTGIAAPASCAGTTDPVVTRALRRGGCETMLRATYADASRTVLTTIGIAVFPDADAAKRAYDAIPEGVSLGVRAVAFAGTVSADFTDAVRETFGSDSDGPYLLFYTAGYADGRTTAVDRTDGETATDDLGTGVSGHESQVLAAPANPCADKDIRC